MRSYAQLHPNLRGTAGTPGKLVVPQPSRAAEAQVSALAVEVASKPSVDDVAALVDSATRDVTTEVAVLHERLDDVEAEVGVMKAEPVTPVPMEPG